MSVRLAIDGGPKTRAAAWPQTGRRFGNEELEQLKEALDQNTLFYLHGTKTKTLCSRMARMSGRKYVVACSSGSAAVHGAVKAAGVGPGDEVITSPITDAGTILGVVYEGGIPVFADIDPDSYNITAASIEKRISSRTRAVILVHLSGVPADVAPIARLCRSRKIALIEDCAQSWGAKIGNRWVGTFGQIGTFSFNDFKHVSAGEGGLIVTDSQALYSTAWRGIDKCYDRINNSRDVFFVAPNYRITELQSAVGIAQLGKLKNICATRHRLGERLSRGLAGIPGVRIHAVPKDGYATYWFYLIGIEPEVLGVNAATFGKALNAEGIAGSGRFYMDPVHLAYSYLREHTAFTHSEYPFNLARKGISYEPGSCPNAEALTSRVFHFPLNEWLTAREIDDTIAAVRKVATAFHERTLAATQAKAARQPATRKPARAATNPRAGKRTAAPKPTTVPKRAAAPKRATAPKRGRA